MQATHDIFEKNKQVNFKTNDKIFEAAKVVFSRKHLDVSSAFNLFLQEVVTKDNLPFETEDEIHRKELIASLQREIQQSVNDYHQGLGVPEEEARARFGV